MVSKVVNVASVALCCAQALAAPREEKLELESANLNMNIIKCTKSVIKAVGVVKDTLAVVKDFTTIVKNGQAAKATCKSNEAATAEEIEACVNAAKTAEINEIFAEVNVAVQKAATAYEEIKDVIDECT
ncbi:uncharacterized protein LOC113210903 isoform X2 [Frankliniella occidentalis]|uniref:Uncharacterized protein LOC113210903 isoform X2 n=1 Tax=Frankliniella occidentalis TaxID=133901 RepID=A0A9C6WX82_FRAOC|nr:uncharacterized protein LOC113210903 isoform X2 [Frankliniella occidentalis]